MKTKPTLPRRVLPIVVGTIIVDNDRRVWRFSEAAGDLAAPRAVVVGVDSTHVRVRWEHSGRTTVVQRKYIRESSLGLRSGYGMVGE